MNAGELRALIDLVPDDTPVTHLQGYDICHIDSVRRAGTAKAGTLRVELGGRVHHEAPAPPVGLIGRWPAVRPAPVDVDKVRAELLALT